MCPPQTGRPTAIALDEGIKAECWLEQAGYLLAAVSIYPRKETPRGGATGLGQPTGDEFAGEDDAAANVSTRCPTKVTEPGEIALPAHILVVDDEPDHLSLMSDLLRPRYRVACADSARQAIEVCRRSAFHLGLLDVRLPDLPGPQLVSCLRALNHHMGFVLVTAFADIRGAVRAVRDLQVIDYISKPFDGRDFLRCVEDALVSVHALSRVILSDLTLCLESRCAWQADRLLPLSSQEFGLLAYLARRPGMVVSHEQLLDELWACDRAGLSPDMLWNVMKRLRAKLGDDRDSPRYIRTVRGIGYQGIASASEGQALEN